ncbi:MAG: hypothetical protein ACRDG4_09840 [Chloroflexota bacterium]
MASPSPAASSLKPYLIGVVITVAVIALFWYLAGRRAAPGGRLDPAYAASVAITDSRVAAAQSMMAGGVVYYDGWIENNGSKTLTSFTVALTFHDIDGKPLATDTRVLLDSRFKPLPPHARRSFEIGFDKVPSGWNQAPPDPRPIAVYTR